MPGKVKVKIVAGRNLPVMDRSSDTTDAYVEIKLGNTTYKTDVCRKSLNPQWNSEWYRFEVDDSELQDEPLQIRLMDHDTYSANDAIGKVYLDLNPLLLPSLPLSMKNHWSDPIATSAPSTGSVMSGWIPVYDTMHGIRGEVNIFVKVELFSDFNRFRQSSCGVQFFCSSSIPQGYHAHIIHGFVEELVVNDDPEYQWIDKIRTPRASNEARQTLFFKLSGEVQRKIGLKALDLGGNAVIGYNQCFDLEGESGIVARGIGTAVSLVRLHEAVSVHGPSSNASGHDDSVSLSHDEEYRLPILGPRFPKTKRKKRKENQVVVIPEPPPSHKRLSHRRQGSAPFELGPSGSKLTPYKRQNSTKSLLSDLSDLRNLLEQEDMRQSPGSASTSRILKAIRHIPRKVNALRGRLSSDDSDLDNVSCSSTKSLSLDFRRKAPKYQRASSDSVTAALIRSIMMDAGSGLGARGLSRVVESEESPASNPATPKSNLFASTSEIELGGAKELLRHISSDIEEAIAYAGSSSSESSTSDDDVSDSSAMKDDDEEDKVFDDSSVSGVGSSSDIQPSPGKINKSRVTFVFDDHLPLNGRNKSRSLSPMGTKKECSISPILIKTNKGKQLDFSHSRSASPKLQTSEGSSLLTLKSIKNKGSPLLKTKTNREGKMKSSSSSLKILDHPDKYRKQKEINPFDQEFCDAAAKISSAVVHVDSLPQPLECPPPPTPPNTAASDSLPSKSACVHESSPICMGKGGFSVGVENSEHNTAPTLTETNTNLSGRTNKTEPPRLVPSGQAPATNSSMSKTSYSSDVELAQEADVLNNPVCSLTLDTPRVLSPLHKSRSTTSLACRHDAAPAPHADGEREAVVTDEDHPGTSAGAGVTTSRGPSPGSHQLLTAHKHSQSPAKVGGPTIHRRSSDSDLSVTPKGNSLTGSDRSSCAGGIHFRPPMMVLRPPTINQESLDMLEYPFLTMTKYPAGFIQSIGGTVSSRSVKLLERITNLEEPETRDTWWKELRMEVRSHARALGCNVVLGYSENTSICDDVCVLSAAGTAAVISLQYNPSAELETSGGAISTAPSNPTTQVGSSEKSLHHHQQPPASGQTQAPLSPQQPLLAQAQADGAGESQTETQQSQMTVVQSQKQCQQTRHINPATSLERNDADKSGLVGKGDSNVQFRPDGKSRHFSDGAEIELPPPCYMCHIPYSETSVPFRVKMIKCSMCRKGKVPDVLLTTMEPPERIPVTGRGCLIQAYVCRPKRDTKGELNAKEISDCLPFLEYELHMMLLNKLKVKGMNAIFGLKVQVSIGERMLVGLATGTAMFVSALPPPPVPTIAAGNAWSDEKRLTQVQKTLADAVKKNRELYHLKLPTDGDAPSNGRCNPSDTEDSDDDLPDLDLAIGNKDTCVLEVDDNEDVDVISLLMDPHPPEGFHVVNTETVPGLEDMEVVRNLQMFTQIWRAKVAPSMPPTTFSKHFHRMLQSVYFKLRRMVPCALAELQFFVELPEPDELQLSLLGMALGLGEADRCQKLKKKALPSATSREQLKKEDNDMIFSLEEDVVLEDTTGAAAAAVAASAVSTSSTLSPPVVSNKSRPKSPHYVVPQNLYAKSSVANFRHTPPRERYGVDITPLSYIPGGKIERYLGNLNFFFIRESTCIREGGGLSGFVHSFIAEVLAIVRAHVTALGGNAMVAYFISENVLLHNPHKNQGQCLINVGGDVVSVSYSDEQSQK